MKPSIPILDMSYEIDALWDDLQAAFQRVLRAGSFIMGEDVALLEQELAAYLGVKHAIAVNSGTDAIMIGLRALGIGPGDEVITTPFTFFATTEPISLLGATPVFVDIDPHTYLIDVDQIEGRITPRTKAILPVHLYGQGVDMTALMAISARHGLAVLEDNAQAFGGAWCARKLGTYGAVGAHSFFPSKNLGAYGDGGLVTTNDDDLATAMRMLRVHGARQKYHNEILGYNSRLDTLQAAILRVKLPHLDRWNAARRAAADRYGALLADIPGIVLPYAQPDAYHVYHQYTIRVLNGQRDVLQRRLNESGIGTMVYYPIPLHRLPVYAKWPAHTLAQAERAAAEVLSLPMYPQIEADVQTTVARAVRHALAA